MQRLARRIVFRRLRKGGKDAYSDSGNDMRPIRRRKEEAPSASESPYDIADSGCLSITVNAEKLPVTGSMGPSFPADVLLIGSGA